MQRWDCGDNNAGLCWSLTSSLLPHPREPDFTSLFHKSLIYSLHRSQRGLISWESLLGGFVLDSLLIHPARRVHVHAAAVFQFVHSAKSLMASAAETTSALIIAHVTTVSSIGLIHSCRCQLLKKKLILLAYARDVFPDETVLVFVFCFFFFFFPLVLLATTLMEHVSRNPRNARKMNAIFFPISPDACWNRLSTPPHPPLTFISNAGVGRRWIIESILIVRCTRTLWGSKCAFYFLGKWGLFFFGVTMTSKICLRFKVGFKSG